MEDIDEGIEHDYRPSQFVKAYPQKIAVATYVKKYDEVSILARTKFCSELDVSYDGKHECKLDLYWQNNTSDSAPVFIFIHGGYWQECSKDISAMVTFPVIEANAIAAIVGYQLAPQASLDEIVTQILNAVKFISERFPNSRLFMSGHCAGAQLTAMTLTHSHWHEKALPNISGLLLLSGIYELTPLLKTSVNIAVKMDKACALRNSPLLLLREQKPVFNCPVVFAFAQLDPPSFKQQSLDFTKVLGNYGISTKCIEIPDTDHFSLLSKCTDCKYQLSQEIIKMLTEP